MPLRHFCRDFRAKAVEETSQKIWMTNSPSVAAISACNARIETNTVALRLGAAESPCGAAALSHSRISSQVLRITVAEEAGAMMMMRSPPCFLGRAAPPTCSC